MKTPDKEAKGKEAHPQTTTGITDKALKFKNEYKAIRDSAVQEQLGIIDEAKKKLTELDYQFDAPAKNGKPAPQGERKQKSCSVCGSQEHNSRFHRNKENAPASAEAKVDAAASAQ